MNKENEYIQIDILKILEGMVKRFWMIVLCMILCGGIMFSAAAFYIAPKYESSVLIYVNNSSFSVGATSFSISASEISAAKSLVETYRVILKTRATINDVIRLGDLIYTYDELVEMITAESINDTEIFAVTVTANDPYEAEHIANTVARVLPDKIANIVEGSSVRIVDYAVVPSEKVSPSIRKFTLVGLLLGMLISCGAIAVMELMDDRITSEGYLLETFGDIPLLSVIPDMTAERSGGQYYYAKPDPDKKRKPSKKKEGGKKNVRTPKA